ncbi:MAG: hypothetical protein ACI4DO_01525 [Roseburia sp.]
MGELILCVQSPAGVPYYMEQTGMNLYSMEELSWFLLNHTDYLDDSFFTEELLNWMEREQNQGENVKLLRKKMRERAGLDELVGILLDSNGFCSKEEKAEVRHSLCDIANMTPKERLKLRADRKVKNHHYHEALRIYQELLSSGSDPKLSAEQTGNVWNNMGVAYAGLFLYQEAARCFGQAYQYNNDPACLRELENANYMACREPADTGEYSENFNRRLETINRLKQAGDENQLSLQYEQQIGEWTRSYESNEKTV